MSALRISRPGQPTEYVLQEPAVARVQGHGGSAMGFFWSGTTLTVHEKRDLAPKKRLPRDGKRWKNPGQYGGNHRCKVDGVTRCGSFMPQAQERCARILGHRGNHSTRYAMDNAAAARRRWDWAA